MSIYMNDRRGPERKRKILGLLKDGKRGDMITFYPGFGYRWTAFAFIKASNKTINVYCYDRSWYEKNDHKIPIANITKDYIKLIDGQYYRSGDGIRNKIGDYAYTLRGFLNMGMVTNVDLEFRRKYTIVNMNGTTVATYFPMKFTWDGDLIGRIPKEAKDKAIDCYREDRKIRNNNARSNYQNTRVIRLMKLAESRNDWSKLKTSDVLCLTNEAKRTELLEHFGSETVLATLDHEVVHEDLIDGRKYELLRFQLPSSGFVWTEGKRVRTETVPATYLKMLNPSTGESCIEGIPNNTESTWRREVTTATVQEALAWRDGDLVGKYVVPVALT